MKSILVDRKEFLRTTINKSTNFQSNLLNHIATIAFNHDIKVSNTMIKVTYKKLLNPSSPNSNGLHHSEELMDIVRDVSMCESEGSPSSSKILQIPKKRKQEFFNGDISIKDNDFKDDRSSISNQLQVVTKIKVQDDSVDFSNSIVSVDSRKEKTELNGGSSKVKNVIKRSKDSKNLNLGIKTPAEKKKNKLVKSKKLKDNEYLGGSKKEILYVDPELPIGWSRYIRTRNKGCKDEKNFVYVVSPVGKKFRYKWKLRKYLEKTRSDLDIDQFFFGLYKKSKHSADDSDKSGQKTKNLTSSSNNSFSPYKTKRNYFAKKYGKIITKEHGFDSGGRELLFNDPELPSGWKRFITANPKTGKMRVHIVSPEGAIFRRKKRLIEYLEKNQHSLDPNNFYFGLHSKESNIHDPGNLEEEEESEGSDVDFNESELFPKEKTFVGMKIHRGSQKSELTPMYEDPTLPEGWKREISVRTCGGTAGRMEVIITSADGRRHRNRRDLEHYFMRYNIRYNPDDFDFTVFGKANKKPIVASSGPKEINVKVKKKGLKASKVKPIPDLDLKKVKELKITPEGQMINSVNGLMVTCELSSARNERRLRIPKNALEKSVKKHLESEGELNFEGCDIPKNWVQTLVKCRSEFRDLDPDAVELIASRTKEFLLEFSKEAFSISQNQENGLQYDDLAEVVDRVESLSPLKNIIPKKITYKEFIKLNRPKHFLSFT